MLRSLRRASSALAAAALIATLALAGCAATDSPDVASLDDGDIPSTTEPDDSSSGGDGVKFAECMREHGIDVPDPEAGDGGGAVQFALPRDSDSSAMNEAMEACEEFLPNGGEPMKLSPEELAEARKFSECMRENGVEDFPDPDADGSIVIEGGAMDVDDEFKAAQEACSAHLPGDGEAPGSTSGEEAS